MKNFGKNLKELRTTKGFSQEVLASKIGIHVTNLSKYERNISVPSLEIAEKMAKTLSISLDELVYGNNKAGNVLQDNQLLNLFTQTQQLNDNQKNTIKDLLEAFILKNNLQKQLAI
ncbi:helix-turn-helix domain-containing protein [Myroides sp. LJL115]